MVLIVTLSPDGDCDVTLTASVTSRCRLLYHFDKRIEEKKTILTQYKNAGHVWRVKLDFTKKELRRFGIHLI